MHLKRGLFRLWLVIAIVWIISLSILALARIPDLPEEGAIAEAVSLWRQKAVAVTSGESENVNPILSKAHISSIKRDESEPNATIITLRDGRRVRVSDKLEPIVIEGMIGERIFEKERNEKIRRIIALAFGAPIAVLASGWILLSTSIWIFRGFQR